MDISIIVCTYNRAPMLRDTLDSFLQMDQATDAQTEVIIVDNNSNDDTAAVSKHFCDLRPQLFRYIKETTQGLSFARNTGIRTSNARLIAFVDDDIYFDRHWLVEMLAVFRTPEAMCAGGRSIPQFEGGTPLWMSTKLLPFYGSTNSGDAFKRMVFPEHPFGLNMAFRREVFEIAGQFNVTLGRIKGSLLSNEEVELFHRIHRNGLAVFYSPLPVVHHRIAQSRARKAWVLRRCYYQGISDMVSGQIERRPSRLTLLRELLGKISWFVKLSFAMLGGCLVRESVAGRKFDRLTTWVYVAGGIERSVRMIVGRRARDTATS